MLGYKRLRETASKSSIIYDQFLTGLTIKDKLVLLFVWIVSALLVNVIPSVQGTSPGESIVIRCSHNSADPSVSITWSREDGREVFDGDRVVTSGTNGEELRISSTEVSDSGVYVCRVTSGEDVGTGRGEGVVGKYSGIC